jgi:uncharacterized membrane protein
MVVTTIALYAIPVLLVINIVISIAFMASAKKEERENMSQARGFMGLLLFFLPVIALMASTISLPIFQPPDL